MKQYDWGTEDRFRSNNGNGPLTARITHVSGEMVHIVWWKGVREPDDHTNKKRAVSLSAKFFFESKSCGWRRAPELEAVRK